MSRNNGGMNCGLVCAAILSWASIAGVALERAQAQSFTYQGKLSETGLPANGLYDMQFAVFDVPVGGAEFGFADTRFGIEVVDGLFTTEVSTLAGLQPQAEMYLEIRVRPSGGGGGGGAFTALTPRTRLSPAPLAMRSLNERWTPSSLNTLRTDSGISTVLINRASPILPDSVLTASRNTTFGDRYAGMYVHGTDPNTVGYYGWGVNGVSRGEAFVDGSDGNFSLSLGSSQSSLSTLLTVAPTGQVALGTPPTGSERLRVLGDSAMQGNVTANNFAYATRRARSKSVHGSAFQTNQLSTSSQVERGTAGSTLNAAVGSASMIAPVELPDGAVVTRVTYYGVDNSAESINMSLVRTEHTQPSGFVISNVGTTGASAAIRAFVDAAPAAHTVDTSTFSYYLVASCGDWGGFNATSIKSVHIEYTVPAPD